MHDKVSSVLEEYGLDNKEASIYRYLVEKGELNAYILSKISGIHRSTTYAILERLMAKGFISKIEKEDATFYSAVEITKIASKMREKEALLLSIGPELENLKEKGISRVRVFESKESQKQFSFNLFNQVLRGSVKDVFIIGAGPSDFVNPQHSKEDLSSKLLMESLIKEFKKCRKHLNLKIIWNERFRESYILKLFSGMGEHRFLKNIPTLATSVIFGEYVVYLFTMNYSPQVIEIQNASIAEENKSYFDYLWKIAKE